MTEAEPRRQSKATMGGLALAFAGWFSMCVALVPIVLTWLASVVGHTDLMQVMSIVTSVVLPGALLMSVVSAFFGLLTSAGAGVRVALNKDLAGGRYAALGVLLGLGVLIPPAALTGVIAVAVYSLWDARMF